MVRIKARVHKTYNAEKIVLIGLFFEYIHKCFTRDTDFSELFHLFLSFLLFLEEFAFTRYISSVELSSHVFAEG